MNLEDDLEDMEEFPLPGSAITGEESDTVIKHFLQKYRINTQGRHPQIPTWVTFPDDWFSAQQSIPNIFEEEQSIPSVFEDKWFVQYDQLYFFNEYGNPVKLYRASPQEIHLFFVKRQPWQDRDYYIFDDTYRWCITITHDNVCFIVVDLMSK